MLLEFETLMGRTVHSPSNHFVDHLGIYFPFGPPGVFHRDNCLSCVECLRPIYNCHHPNNGCPNMVTEGKCPESVCLAPSGGCALNPHGWLPSQHSMILFPAPHAQETSRPSLVPHGGDVNGTDCHMICIRRPRFGPGHPGLIASSVRMFSTAPRCFSDQEVAVFQLGYLHAPSLDRYPPRACPDHSPSIITREHDWDCYQTHPSRALPHCSSVNTIDSYIPVFLTRASPLPLPLATTTMLDRSTPSTQV